MNRNPQQIRALSHLISSTDWIACGCFLCSFELFENLAQTWDGESAAVPTRTSMLNFTEAFFLLFYFFYLMLPSETSHLSVLERHRGMCCPNFQLLLSLWIFSQKLQHFWIKQNWLTDQMLWEESCIPCSHRWILYILKSPLMFHLSKSFSYIISQMSQAAISPFQFISVLPCHCLVSPFER